MSKPQTQRLAKDSKYIRRRDKVLVIVDKYSGQSVEYHTWPELIAHKVSLEGFRKGFRPATPKEIPNEVATTPGSGPAAE